MIRKAADIKLKVLPVYAAAEHLYYYEGPCRFGQGEALQPGFDGIMTAQMIADYNAKLKEIAPEGVEIMDHILLKRTDNWDNNEAMYDEFAQAAAEADVYFAMNRIAVDDLMEEFLTRFPKTTVFNPHGSFSSTIHYASLKAYNPDYEFIAPITWATTKKILRTLRARKVIHNTRILCINRFGSNTSFSSVDAFHNQEDVARRLGVRFRFVNIHEFFEDLHPALPEGNVTTPGRETWNLDEKDMEEVKKITDELINGAENNYMDREQLEKSVQAFVLVRKLMDYKDCNGFTVPCPDACSTRRLNEIGFTFCLTHSLNMEDKIPSACEYDTAAVVSQQMLIAVSGKSPYMGNTIPVVFEDGKFSPNFALEQEEIDKLLATGDTDNIYYTQHSVSGRNYHDDNKGGKYDIRPFALDQGFGATLKYDFDQDKDQVLTLCRISPDGKKLFIGKGEIICCGGMNRGNCSHSVFYRVKDQYNTYVNQRNAGNHVSLVYGDYTDELSHLADMLGLEKFIAE